MKHISSAVIGVFIAFVVFSAQAERRVALVIGNTKYQTVSPLKNPGNDAILISKSLRQSGFEVTLVRDTTEKELKIAILKFSKALKNADVGLFYYAGHGMQLNGANYLVPIDARLEEQDYLDLEAVNLNQVLTRMGSAGNRMNIVVLDACRNNPFRSFSRSANRGLAVTRAPVGTYIAYATRPGDIAVDGIGDNSPFTKALAKAMNEPGQSLEEVFKSVRRQVRKQTDGRQIPWTSSSIEGIFKFIPGASATHVDQENKRLKERLAAVQKRAREAENAENESKKKLQSALQNSKSLGGKVAATNAYDGIWYDMVKAHEPKQKFEDGTSELRLEIKNGKISGLLTHTPDADAHFGIVEVPFSGVIDKDGYILAKGSVDLGRGPQNYRLSGRLNELILFRNTARQNHSNTSGVAAVYTMEKE